MSAKTSGRFWFEYAGDDLPFYDGEPTALSPARWGLVLVAVALGFAALIAPIPRLQAGLAGFAPALLFFAIPLTALAIVAPRGWTRLFRRIQPRDVFWMVAFAVLNIAITFAIGYAVQKFLGAGANPMIERLPALSTPDRLLFFARTIPQLFGEEVLTILPFLAIVTWLHRSAGASRRWAIFGAWILSAALFGMAHLPTYDWNLAQCLLIIGGARLVLTLPYVMSKNIWVSTGAHIVNDWALFGAAALIAGRH
ncbi:CPBP family intramembrane glutamic endopeptidase [Caulobacter sp. RHG1]|uniref:CPBP family intramembrane glutamic endopeptidase n=1 Tax=Caulobacter sp. (strain RHG1) TaxID=2545762 RepID=UPI001556E9CD|nr:CPBP family intramembrane glutamic endopeptidase [Caulobacter sp. RHG1]NQE64010.1 hypothetical protein [Caulobacter sp. RHG1]